jgi:mannose-6-phosphate isomerase class I
MLSFYTMAEANNIVQVTDEVRGDIHIGSDGISAVIAKVVKNRNGKTFIGLDGYMAVAWKQHMEYLALLLRHRGFEVSLFAIEDCYIGQQEREKIIRKCTDDVDPWWGRVYDGTLEDYLIPAKVNDLKDKLNNTNGKLNHLIIVYGPGAICNGLKDIFDFTGYIDITRQEVFNRIDRREVNIISTVSLESVKEPEIRRRVHYIDFEILRNHRNAQLSKVDWYFIDRPDRSLIMIPLVRFNQILEALSKQPFRPLPFYFPRVWGGDCFVPVRKLPMKKCSFYIDVVASVNSIRIIAGDAVLDIPFLTFMALQGKNIVGGNIFNYYHGLFPITSSYDDTIGGGSLALQCHPGRKQMQEVYNEDNSHDETYYVVKTAPGAKTFHGLRDGVNWEEFRKFADRAEKEHIPFDYEKYVNFWESKEEDMFLLPSGTTHASGENQIVLEIDQDGSKNGMEYTYHVYDFLRPDMDGSYRPIHNDHYFNEVRREAERKWTEINLKQPPKEVLRGPWGVEYCTGDFHELNHISNRIELKQGASYTGKTEGGFALLFLTKGDSVLVRRTGDLTDKGYTLSYTEAIIVPASIDQYEIINLGGDCHVLKTFVRKELK